MGPKTYYVEFITDKERRKEYVQARNCDSANERIKKEYPNVKIIKTGRASNEKGSYGMGYGYEMLPFVAALLARRRGAISVNQEMKEETEND